MPKVSKTIFASLLVILNYTDATYTNLIYNAPSVAFPGLFTMCGTQSTVSATDRVITLYESDTNCNWFNYLFVTSMSNEYNCRLTITLPATTTVRTVLFSARDRYLNIGIGLTVSVGDTFALSKSCTWTTNTGATSTSSKTGLSAWLTCNNLAGSKLFVTNPYLEWV